MAEELIQVYSKNYEEQQDSTPHEKLTTTHFDGDQKFSCPHAAGVVFFVTKPDDVEMYCVQESTATANNYPELWRITAASEVTSAIIGPFPFRKDEKYALNSRGGTPGTKNVFIRIVEDIRKRSR